MRYKYIFRLWMWLEGMTSFTVTIAIILIIFTVTIAMTLIIRSVTQRLTLTLIIVSIWSTSSISPLCYIYNKKHDCHELKLVRESLDQNFLCGNKALDWTWNCIVNNVMCLWVHWGKSSTFHSIYMRIKHLLCIPFQQVATNALE